MKRILFWAAACMLLLPTVYMGYVYTQGDACEWTIEPKVDGTVHVKGLFTLGFGYPYVPITSSIFQPIKNLKAWEAESGKSLDIKETDKGNRIEYEIQIPGIQGGGYQFYMEYDQLLSVFKIGDSYRYYFGWTSWIRTVNTATVILPKNHELLYTDYLDPVDVTSNSQTRVTFVQDTPEDESFKFEVVFSDEGIRLLKDAENNLRKKEYSKAKDKYEAAIEFYSQFEKLYNRNKEEFLADLKRRMSECETEAEEDRIEQEKQQAEEKYEEAMAAFNNGSYVMAGQLFRGAQDLYKSLGDTEKVDECQGYMDQCAQFAAEKELRNEAEALFNEGVTYLEQLQYEEAKSKFEEALAKYTELGDEEKIQECKEQIASCEEEPKSEKGEESDQSDEDTGPCMGSSFVVLILLASAFINTFMFRRNRK